MIKKLTLAAVVATFLSPIAAWAEQVDYEKGLVKQALAEGKTVFVDYAADWCITCKIQEDAIDAARAQNPAYDENILFVRVDWDRFSRAKIATDYNIPRRSTLIVLKGDKELGRNVADTRGREIKKLLDIALAAASS